MKHLRKIKLKEKGWSDAEIIHAENILEQAQRQNPRMVSSAFWSTLIVVIVGNLALSVFLMPLLIFTKGILLYSALAASGIVFGFIYNFVLTHVGDFEKEHHFLAGTLIFLLAFTNIALLIYYVNQLEIRWKIDNPHSLIILSLIFLGAFILPYIVDQIRLMLKKRKAI